ncbi:acetyltransferase [Streptomyces yokosukanensis]|uniref:Acetyltransferase n=1 Tax=Streptomyces yokosukanensis TaxID=67386 RepID=A0A117Q421_9ACTN|nr:GNAT family N-acetyltransferase [Streptomyces yokosukanensis]KUN07093.1 acetyltransferase [Streptomyces yokosukanensis]
MRPDDWHITEDLDDFLARTGDFLRSRPALHTTPLTAFERLRTRGVDGAGETVFGRLEPGGEVSALFYRLPTRRLTVTALSPEQADTLAARLTGLGLPLSGVHGDNDSAVAFARAWQRRTGAAPVLSWWGRLHRLGAPVPPRPRPQGRGRLLGEEDREDWMRWCGEFVAAVGEAPADSWADSRFADKHFTFWETPDGTPVSMAGSTSLIGGMVRIDPVYTPAHLRGRGYAGAVTVEVSRAALAAGAREVVLFTDPANPTSNALYRRIGYVPVAYFVSYDFSYDVPGAAPEAGRSGRVA